MNVLGFVVIVIALQGAVQSGVQSPTDIANVTKYELTYDGKHVTSCTVTATSGSPEVDRYICDAARLCGERYSNDDSRTTCLATKRDELAKDLARTLAPHR